MSVTNVLGSEEWAVVGVVDPDANGAGTLYTADIDMSLWEQLMLVAMVGDFVATGKADAGFVSGAAATPTVAVTGKAITQLTQAGTDDNKQAIVNLRGDELTEGHRYVRGYLTLTTAGADSAVIVLGKGKHAPSSDNDSSTVDEIVA